MKLKEFLTENTNRLNKKEYLNSVVAGKWKIVNGLIDVVGDVDLALGDYRGEIPFKFGKVDGDFKCWQIQIMSLFGCPHTVTGDFACDGISSFKYAPRKIGGNVCAVDDGGLFKSFIGVADDLPEIGGGVFEFDFTSIEEGGLGLILIKDIQGFCPLYYPCKGPFAIIEKYLGRGEDGLIECQSELIEAGFEEFAQL